MEKTHISGDLLFRQTSQAFRPPPYLFAVIAALADDSQRRKGTLEDSRLTRI